MSTDPPTNSDSGGPKAASATRFFLRGLGIALPAILTVVIVIWIAGVINSYIISPIGYGVRFAISLGIDESQPSGKLVFWDKLPPLDYCEENYKITPELKTDLEKDWGTQDDHRNPDGSLPPEIPVAWLMRQVDDITETPRIYVPFGERAVPYRVYRDVAKKVPDAEIPSNSRGVYMEFVTIEYFGSQFLLSSGAIAVAVVLMYFIGRLVTVRIGAWVVHQFESVVLERMPVISTIYSAVKQVTDFLFSERQVEYNRVVAIEYPRRGIWSLGFVTGDSMLEMTTAAGEPLVTVLIPTSPMPVTGYTMSVPRRELIDLNVTIDQAFQFCVSCGVLVPPHQQVTPELLQQALAKRLTGELAVGSAAGTSKGLTDGNNTDGADDHPSPDSKPEQTETTA
jgi:uncharacterized membrane protein